MASVPEKRPRRRGADGRCAPRKNARLSKLADGGSEVASLVGEPNAVARKSDPTRHPNAPSAVRAGLGRAGPAARLPASRSTSKGASQGMSPGTREPPAWAPRATTPAVARRLPWAVRA